MSSRLDNLFGEVTNLARNVASNIKKDQPLVIDPLQNERRMLLDKERALEDAKAQWQNKVAVRENELASRESKLQEQAHQQAIITTQQEQERARVAEIARDVLNKYSLSDLADMFTARLAEIDKRNIVRAKVGDSMLRLYEGIQKLFERHDLLPPDKRLLVRDNAFRLYQIEILMDTFLERVQNARDDVSLSDDLRERKVDYLTRLMDTEMEHLEGNHG